MGKTPVASGPRECRRSEDVSGVAVDRPKVDIGLIASILQRHRMFDDEDVVFVGGSVADGLATPWSDVDVFVICKNAPGNGLHLVPMPHDEMPMDLEVWPSGEVDQLLKKLGEIGASAASDHRAFMRLTDDERDLLHCLVNGIPVHNGQGLLRLQAQVDRALLPQLSIARSQMGITNAQTDLLGWLAAGDWQSAGAACQRLVEFSGLAILGASGCTHPGGKWLLTLLRTRLESRVLPPRLLSGAPTLADRFYALQIKPSRSEAMDSYARACVAFSNLAVLYAQTSAGEAVDDLLRRILWLPETPPTPVLDGERRPALSCATQLRCHAGQWYLLHVGREMYELNATAAGMILLIDGQASEREILNMLAGLSSTDRALLSSSWRDLLLFLENADLLAA